MKVMNSIYLITISLLVSSIFGKAQDIGILSINGIIKGADIKEGTASIIPISLGLDCMAYKFDSFNVAVVNNHFHFSGTMPYPHGFEEIIVRSNTTSFRTGSFFLDSGNITMTLYNSEEQLYPDIEHSAANYEYQNKFLPRYQPIQFLLDSFINIRYEHSKQYNKAVPDSVHEGDLKIRNQYTKKRNIYLRQYIHQHPDSYIPLALLGQSTEREDYDLTDIKRTFLCLSSEMKNTISGAKLEKAFEIKNLKALSDNLKMLAFVDNQNMKKTIFLNNNKYVLIDFWFSNCRPCISQFSQLSSIYEIYKNKGFEIIGISTDKNEDDWKSAVAKYKLSWQQLWDENNFTSSKLLIYGFPSNFLLDSNGKIINHNIEPYQLENFLKENITNK